MNRAEVVAAQFALLTHLPPGEAGMAADRAWTLHTCRRLLAVAGHDAAVVLVPEELTALTGRAPAANDWGWASWGHHPHVVFVDPAKTRTRQATLALAAHEITHLTHHGRGFRRHSARWFAEVQDLLDRASCDQSSQRCGSAA